MFSSWADALREQHPASFHDVLKNTAFEEGGKKYKFGVYVIKNVVSTRTLREWAAGVHDLYKQKTRIKTKACTIGKDFYKSVQAVQKPCVCIKYELEAVTSYYRAQPTLIIPDTAATAKRQLTETTMGQSPEWSTPKRRLRLNVTDEFGKSGTSAMT